MHLPETRRVVTGHDSRGRSIILSDERLRLQGSEEIGQGAVSLASFAGTPSNEGAFAQELAGLPGPGESAFTVVQFPPFAHIESLNPELRAVAMSSPADHLPGLVKGDTGRHYAMHYSETVDCGVVLSGEVVMLMDEGEVVLRAGDTFVQRGTAHAWANRGDAPVVMAVVMIGAAAMSGRS